MYLKNFGWTHRKYDSSIAKHLLETGHIVDPQITFTIISQPIKASIATYCGSCCNTELKTRFMHTKGIYCWLASNMEINLVIIIGSSYLFIISLNIPSVFFCRYISRIISLVILYLSLISNVLSSRIDNNYHKRQTFWLALLIDHLTLWPIWPVSFPIAHIVVIYDLIECTPAEWDFTKCFIMDPVILHSVFWNRVLFLL